MAFTGFNNKKKSTISSGDWDGDGVSNRKDCNAMDWKKQDGGEPFRRCEDCGRRSNREKLCSECSMLNYMHSQGAITPEGYKKWKKELK